MARVRSPWHALRPVFLAGAATFAWLTFSSSPASADLLPEPTPAVNEILIDSPTTDMLAPVVDAVPGTEPAAPVTAVVEDTVGVVEQVVVPPAAGIVAATEPLIDPVLESAEPVLVPVQPILDPVLAPVVAPVTELVPALEPLVELAPEGPALAIAGLLPDGANEPAATGPALNPGPAREPAPASTEPRQALAAGPPLSAPLTAVAVPLWAGPTAYAESPEPAPVPPSSPPAPVPVAPGSGGPGSGGPSPGPAAWLSPVAFVLPFLGAASAPEFVLRAPEPVSFDPGSSPD
ncbi:hypothetical protein ACIQCN_13140 [Pseudarthrobacter sp. NPDC092424]|uniref:hypothetical protein n=1 Tax=Pseudarthrobacter sp. NPDC092424 TaxID=3364415 RepID=UPI0038128B16